MRPYSTNRSGSAILDDAPPSPQDRIYRKPSPPGADTESLLGGPTTDDVGGSEAALSSPANKLLMAVSMFMQASNIADSIAPGFVPDQVKMWIAQAMEQGPQLAQQLASQGNPLSMLAGAGASAAASNQMPMGSPAMGMQGAPGDPLGGMGGGGRPPGM
jgi:hypothetical protein